MATKAELSARLSAAAELVSEAQAAADELRGYLHSPKFGGDGDLAGYVSVDDVLLRLAPVRAALGQARANLS